ncbi:MULTISPECIES: hypothetical protein [unclassified Haloarcula]|uniref:hypothetical protein n=1 Tax=unclassified Haloarcula TaxID=2624677 RepID=UPI000AFD8CE5|nr:MULTISPECIES: hypothetical protein [unclassified Haloarcula]
MSPEVWFILFLFVVVTVPVFIGVVAFINRATGEETDEELEELKQRVEELEAQQD